MMPGCPDISVVIVTHNARSSLLDCLASLDAQRPSPPPMEVIVVDDGSTDGSAEAVGEAFPEVSIIRTPNQGADLSRNLGLEAARSEVIAFLDADCVADDGWVSAILAELEAHPTAVVGGRVIHRGPLLRRVVGIADFGEYQGPSRREASSLPTCSLAAARSVLAGHRFDPRLADAGGDTVFTDGLRRAGATLVYQPAVMVEHRPAVSLGELLRRARRYGRSFVRARQVDPSLRYAGFVRAGIPGVTAATLVRIVLDWWRLLRHRRAAGFALWELPAGAAVLALRRLVSLPEAVRTIRSRPVFAPRSTST